MLAFKPGTNSAANATMGAVYQDANGANYTVSSTIVGATSLGTTGTTLPPASGVLTKISGTGDATITYSAVSAPDCSISVAITAVVAGKLTGNAAVGTINSIETSLTDSSVVCSNAGNSTGADAMDTPTYRTYILNLLQAMRAAVIAAIEAAAQSVTGVVTATAIEIEQAVIFYNIATQSPVADQDWFFIPFATLYVADDTGTASSALIAAVQAAVDPIRAYGVFSLARPLWRSIGRPPLR